MGARWTWAAASCRGVSHVRSNVRLQDAFKCFAPDGTDRCLVAVVSDGAGSASHGGQGASLVCRVFAARMRKHFSETAALPDESITTSWLDETRDLLLAVAQRHELQLRDFAATLIFVASTGSSTVVFHVGDGCAVLRNEATADWFAPVWPTHGEYASTTSFVTDETHPQHQFVRSDEPISALAAFTDGLERLVLDLKSQQPHARFFNRIIEPVEKSAADGRNATLSSSLRQFLDSTDINERTDDDKTLVLAVRR